MSPADPTPDPHLADLGVAELARRISGKEVSSVEVVEACLARIAERDPGLNAFSVVLGDQARAEAAERDRSLQEGEEPGPLHGVPVAIKEEIDVAGCVTTFGGRANSTPAAEDAELVRRLRAAGAVIIGKTRMPEFGQWPYTESVAGGHTHNPWNPRHTPGGSSGGTAVAVAAGMVPVGHRRRRGRVDPDPVGLLRAVRPQARARPGDDRADGAPVVGARHGRTAGPVGAGLGDRLRRHPRAAPTGTCSAHRTRRRRSPRRPARSRGRLRIGWSTKSPIKGVRPDPAHVQAVQETAQVLTDLGHEVIEVDPRYPDATLAFVPQFFGGVRDGE